MNIWIKYTYIQYSYFYSVRGDFFLSVRLFMQFTEANPPANDLRFEYHDPNDSLMQSALSITLLQ